MKKKGIVDFLKTTMRITITQIILAAALTCTTLAAHVEAQILDQRVSLSVDDVEIRYILKQIQKQIAVKFVYSPAAIQANRKASVDVKDRKLGEILTEILTPLQINFQVKNNRILLYRQSSQTLNQGEREGQPVSDPDEVIQQQNISGKVTDESGQGMPGVNVVVKGTNQGTTTDADGIFTISVENGSETLVFSFIGYALQEVPINNRSVVDVSLVPEARTLQEVVVIGYGQQERKDVTGAIGTVKSEELNAMPSATVENQLQGRIAGVTVTTNGQPGSGASIRIRGLSTFTGNNSPLYIVDGVQTFDISTLNPNDIDQISVLKDAGAASIYGSRASNGVVLITTKKGKAGEVQVTYNGYYGTQSPGKGYTHLLNAQEMANLTWLAQKNGGKVPASAQYGNGTDPVLPDYIIPTGTMEGSPSVNPDLYNIDFLKGPIYQIVRANKNGTDWFDELTDAAPMQSHDVAVSGGNAHSNFLLGVNYFNQQGIVLNTFAKRYSIRANSEFTIKKKVRIGENIQVSFRRNSGVNNLNASNPIAQTFQTHPIIPVTDIFGNWAGSAATEFGAGGNPVADQSRGKNNKAFDVRLFGNIYAEADILKDFTVRSSFGGSFQFNNYKTFYAKSWEGGFKNSINQLYEGSGYYGGWTWTNTANYKKSFDSHTINALLGTEAVADNIGGNLDASRQNFVSEDPDFWVLTNGSATSATNSSSSYTPRTTLSFFARVDYSFKDKYLLSATVRRDGSSVFAHGNKYGNFPAVTGAWRISEESFMKTQNFINDLKLRVGYGIMGSQFAAGTTDQYDVYDSYAGSTDYDLSGSGNSTFPGYKRSVIPNANVQWEENKTTNIGLDFTLFNNSLDVMVDVYEKRTEKLLYSVESPGVVGVFAANAALNVGSMKNRGIDLQITKRGKFGKAWRYEAGLVYTMYRNEITEIDNRTGTTYFDAGNFVRNEEGFPFFSFYGYQIEGLWQSQDEIDAADNFDGEAGTDFQSGAAIGRFRYQDSNGDGTITDDDRVHFGDPNPKFTAGLNLTVGYRNFDLTVFLYGVAGRDIINYTKYYTDFYSSAQGVKSNDLLYNSWTPENPSAKTPIAEEAASFSSNQAANSYYLEDGSYLRAKNIQLSYSLSDTWLSNHGLGKARIYLQATNVFTLTKYSGLDPELGESSVPGNKTANGVDVGNYPMVRQFLVGVNLSF